jgi:hypothetical protein
MNRRFKSSQAEAIPPAGGAFAPWSTRGPEKEEWKDRGHRYDLRDLDATRPADLRIMISPPHSSVGA